MKTKVYSAKVFIGSGHYGVSDSAAGALVRATGHKLPKIGYEKFVMLQVNGEKLNAWLTRTPCAHSFGHENKRGWKWAVYGMRRDNEGSFGVILGEGFKFQPHSV